MTTTDAAKHLSGRNIILYGPPGTGKTYRTTSLAVEEIEGKPTSDDRALVKERYDQYVSEGRIGFVTFHPSFSYEEFVQGISASTENGRIVYCVRDGIFKSFCEKAAKEPDKRYVFIIDEINRGNIARIFGELITLLEVSKRSGEAESLSVCLPYAAENEPDFSIPGNITVIGTMNTADRSLTSLDAALRRRFEFEAVMPDPSLLDGLHIEDVSIRRLFERLNDRLAWLLDDDHRLGHSYFLTLRECADDNEKLHRLADIFRTRIIPQLGEYFFDDTAKAALVLNDFEAGSVFAREDVSRLFSDGSSYALKTNRYTFRPEALLDLDTYRRMAL